MKNLKNFSQGPKSGLDASRMARIKLESVQSNLRERDGEIPLASEIEFITDCSMELPRINDQSVAGKFFRHSPDYKFVYAVSIDPKSPSYFFDSIIKVNVQSKTFKRWSPGVGLTPSEPVFIQRPDAKNEDDGILMSVCLNGHISKSQLYFIDAKEMETLSVCDLPDVVPFGFHGSFDA